MVYILELTSIGQDETRGSAGTPFFWPFISLHVPTSFGEPVRRQL